MAHALLPVQFAWLCGQEVGYVDRTSGRKILNLDLKPASFYEITAQGHRSLALENSNFYLDIQVEGLRFKGGATKRLSGLRGGCPTMCGHRAMCLGDSILISFMRCGTD